MQVIVLIGGQGTRLYPLTYAVPKVGLPIANRPFLDHMLAWFARNGVSQVVFTVHNLEREIRQAIEKLNPKGIELVVRSESEPLGSGGALKNCADLLAEQFLLLNGDILTDLNLKDLYLQHQTRRALITVAVAPVDEPSHYGIIDASDDGAVREWQEKPARSHAKSNLANVGAWAMSKAVVELIPELRFVSLEKEIFPSAIIRGLPFFAYRFDGYWKDIGTVEKYIEANVDLMAGRVRGFAASLEQKLDGPKVTGSVLLGKGCDIDRSAVIEGPSVIGDSVVIGKDATIRASVIWNGSRIGERTSIVNSVVAGAEIGADCVLSDNCVIAQSTVVGTGQILAPKTVLGPRSSLPPRGA
jgi:NDP-sugar pyrophosphorylase family protein